MILGLCFGNNVYFVYLLLINNCLIMYMAGLQMRVHNYVKLISNLITS